MAVWSAVVPVDLRAEERLPVEILESCARSTGVRISAEKAIEVAWARAGMRVAVEIQAAREHKRFRSVWIMRVDFN